jgi:hypothetical protein
MSKPVGFNTIMNRIVKLWCTAKPIATEMSARGVCVWNPDGQSFTLKWHNIHGRVIKLDTFRHYVINEADRLKETFRALAPHLDFSSILLSQFVDDAESPTSLFDRVHNQQLFAPFIQQIRKHFGLHEETMHPSALFTRSGVLKKKQTWTWLKSFSFCSLRISIELWAYHRELGKPPIFYTGH